MEEFKSFDLTISGSFDIPKHSITLLKKEYFFLIGGIVPMTFGKLKYLDHLIYAFL